ncbi:hypothetical protein DV735_g1109, partial [Chaetothyriales sp. CBS 134920]
MSTKPAIVLVPGAWHTPEGFKQVIDLLEAAGYEVKAVHLASVGAPVPLQDFRPDVEAVQTAIREFADQGKDVLVLGHSYGGVVITEATNGLDKATREKQGLKGGVSHLYFLCAFVLPEDHSLATALDDKPLPWFEVSEDQLLVTPKQPAEVFYNDVEDPSAIIKTLKPHSFRTFFSKVTYAGWKYVPNTYLLCAKDAAIPLALQQAMVDRARSLGANFTTHDMDASHSPFLSKPEELALSIRRAAGEKL